MAWKPKKTFEELKNDPKRALRATATGGMSEIPHAIPEVGDALDKVSATFTPKDKPDTSMDDAAMAAAAAARGTSVDEFVNSGPAKYNAGTPLTRKNYETGNPLSLKEVGPLDQQVQSGMAGIKVDPKFKDAEMSALSDLENQSKNGYTARDQAEIAKMQSKTNAAQRGRLGAIQQNMQNRGMAGSGLDIMSQTQSAQDSAENEALKGLEQQAQMMERKQSATSRMGNMAGQMGSREFDQQAQQAKAQDDINRFNTSNSVNRTFKNTDINNTGTTANWNRANSTSDKNVDGDNEVGKDNWGRTNSTSDNNSSAAYTFSKDRMGAKTGQAGFAYDMAADSKNSKMSDWQAKEEERKRKLGAAAGLAGGVAGAALGKSPQAATAGQSIGTSAGGMFAEGGKVDSYLNDKVPALLSPGEKVIPASVSGEHLDKEAAFLERTEAEQAIKGLLEAMAYLTKSNK